jgi:hypothetical protein
MTIDERARHELFLGCETALGPERAETLMALLPPVGWADVATKQDLTHLEERLTTRSDARFEGIDARFEAIDARFDAMGEQIGLQFETIEAKFTGELHRALNSQTKTLFFGIITVLTSLAALGVAFAR